MDGGDVGGEAGEAKVEGCVAREGEDLGEVVADCEGLEAETEIAGYCYAAGVELAGLVARSVGVCTLCQPLLRRRRHLGVVSWIVCELLRRDVMNPGA